jgi:hypothetical protein
MSRVVNQRRAVSLLFLPGSVLLIVATWDLPDPTFLQRMEPAAEE